MGGYKFSCIQICLLAKIPTNWYFIHCTSTYFNTVNLSLWHIPRYEWNTSRRWSSVRMNRMVVNGSQNLQPWNSLRLVLLLFNYMRNGVHIRHAWNASRYVSPLSRWIHSGNPSQSLVHFPLHLLGVVYNCLEDDLKRSTWIVEYSRLWENVAVRNCIASMNKCRNCIRMKSREKERKRKRRAEMHEYNIGWNAMHKCYTVLWNSMYYFGFVNKTES